MPWAGHGQGQHPREPPLLRTGLKSRHLRQPQPKESESRRFWQAALEVDKYLQDLLPRFPC